MKKIKKTGTHFVNADLIDDQYCDTDRLLFIQADGAFFVNSLRGNNCFGKITDICNVFQERINM